ncbi:MAG: biopolymer transporter ExbD [Bacteriovoracaceae bacterium]
MKKRFARKRNTEMADVDITSLLDVLVILLVFLLKNYNASDLKLDLAKKTEMAESEARRMTRFAPVVQISKEAKVYLNNKEIGRLPAGSDDLTFLSEALRQEKSKMEADATMKKNKVNFDLLNLVVDRDHEYAVVQQVMHASAMAGYSQFKFLVKGNY